MPLLDQKHLSPCHFWLLHFALHCPSLNPWVLATFASGAGVRSSLAPSRHGCRGQEPLDHIIFGGMFVRFMGDFQFKPAGFATASQSSQHEPMYAWIRLSKSYQPWISAKRRQISPAGWREFRVATLGWEMAAAQIHAPLLAPNYATTAPQEPDPRCDMINDAATTRAGHIANLWDHSRQAKFRAASTGSALRICYV